MLVTTFENNGRNISKNIVKLNLKEKTNLYCIIIWSTYVQRKHIFDKPVRWDWEHTLKEFAVKGHNWVSLTYCDFNLYLVVTRLIQTSKPLDGFKVISAFHSSETDLISTKNFW